MGIGLQRSANKVLTQGFDGTNIGKDYKAVQQFTEQYDTKQDSKDTQGAAFLLFLFFRSILSDIFRLLNVIRKFKVILVKALDGATPPCKNSNIMTAVEVMTVRLCFRLPVRPEERTVILVFSTTLAYYIILTHLCKHKF